MSLNFKLLGYDEGKQTLGTYDTQNPDWGWTLSLEVEDLPMGRDLQKIGPNRVLVGFDRGYFELNLDRGIVTKIIDRWSNVTSTRRLNNGTTLVTGIDLVDKGINVITLDINDDIIKVVSREGDYVRMMRPTPNGTYLLGSDDHFLETDHGLVGKKNFSTPGLEHTWLAHRFSNGSTLLSGGYGAFMVMFNSNGSLNKKFGSKQDVPLEVSPFFYASFELLSHGGILVANWQGHGRDNGSRGRQLVEFDKNGDYLGSWSDKNRISSLQGILII